MVSIRRFLEGLFVVSEKASQITRIIRGAYWNLQDGKRGSIATEEKDGRLHGGTDFKTLGDVLCQAVIDSELRKMFPELTEIHGEENGSFQTQGGDKLCIQINGNIEETSALLAKALPNPETVSQLTALIHSKISVSAKLSDELSAHTAAFQTTELNLSEVGVWIDPIDATAEYVKARKPVVTDEGIYSQGLPCCTVIIGAYDTRNGRPIAGVVSRPFNNCDTGTDDLTRCESKIYWGCYYPDTTLSVLNPSCARAPSSRTRLTIAHSAGESMPFVMNNPNQKYQLMSPKGAGNKMLTVVNGLADLYLITVESNVVYRWDVCAGHALLKAHGGGLLCYKSTLDSLKSYRGLLEDFPFTDFEIDYRGNADPLVNGIVAYADLRHVISFFSDLLTHLQ